MKLTEVLTVADIREQLASVTQRVQGEDAEPVYYGQRRKAQAVIVGVDRYQELIAMEERIQRQQAVQSALASARLEGAEPSDAGKEDLAKYAAGEISDQELISRGRARYGLG
jgi:PHD/YefM family antitoxin component YafN of YafNO toxin-antitoxin module